MQFLGVCLLWEKQIDVLVVSLFSTSVIVRQFFTKAQLPGGTYICLGSATVVCNLPAILVCQLHLMGLNS